MRAGRVSGVNAGRGGGTTASDNDDININMAQSSPFTTTHDAVSAGVAGAPISLATPPISPPPSSHQPLCSVPMRSDCFVAASKEGSSREPMR